MRKLFFIADTHFGHNTFFHERYSLEERVRPFSSVDTWNEHILDGINGKVNRKDTLFILGDFAFNHAEFKFRQRIKCKDIWFVFGNHDNRARCSAAFGPNKCRDILCRKVRGIQTVMCHYPMFVWPSSHHGSWHLFGHVHAQRSRFFDELFPEMKSLDVSPDSHNRLFGTWEPFSEDEVESLLTPKSGHDNLSFYKDYQKKYLRDQKIVK